MNTTCGCETGRCRESPTPREIEDREIRKLCGMSDVGQTLDGVRRLLARAEKAEEELTRETHRTADMCDRAVKAERGLDEALARAEKAEEELRELRFEHQVVLRTVRVERFKP